MSAIYKGTYIRIYIDSNHQSVIMVLTLFNILAYGPNEHALKQAVYIIRGNIYVEYSGKVSETLSKDG